VRCWPPPTTTAGRAPIRGCFLTAALAGWATAVSGQTTTVDVRDTAGLKAACVAAEPGTVIRLAPGDYRPGVYVGGKSGGPGRPIVIEGADAENPPVFVGGNEALHFSGCSHLTLRHLVIRGAKQNGLNIDDGDRAGSARHVLVENVTVEDVGPRGNHDAIKLSGLDDFAVRGCVARGWGGQGIDMVGCHRGLIEGCSFAGKEGFTQSAGVQAKGGSREITIRRCLFDRAGERGVNAGGSTDAQFFRPPEAAHEAAAITVEGCTFRGGTTPIAFVGVDGAAFRFNTIYDPEKWFCRILQENGDLGKCRDGRVDHNLFVFRAQRTQGVNVGPDTKPETFRFTDNFWFAMDDPAASRQRLPVAEERGVHGIDPRLAALEQGGLEPRTKAAAGYGATALPQARP